MAGAGGIEPTLTVLETVVLPLYDAPTGFSCRLSIPGWVREGKTGGLACAVSPKINRKNKPFSAVNRLWVWILSGGSLLFITGQVQVIMLWGQFHIERDRAWLERQLRGRPSSRDRPLPRPPVTMLSFPHMSSPFPPRRRSPFARGPRISDEEVLEQLRRSLKALHRANQALERVRDTLRQGAAV